MDEEMKLNFCAVCGTTNDLQQHHIEPVVVTGAKRKKAKGYDDTKQLKDCESTEIFAYLFSKGIISDDGEITVCSYHHNLLHGIVKFQQAEHNKLIKLGQQRAKENGVILGRPTTMTKDKVKTVQELRSNNVGIKTIAKEVGIGIGTVYSILNQYGLDPIPDDLPLEDIPDSSWVNLIEKDWAPNAAILI